jgi:hypothetical protein
MKPGELDAALAALEEMIAQRDEARRERDEARSERDEARREVCQKHEHGYFTDEDYAEVRGWDCFKEVKP